MNIIVNLNGLKGMYKWYLYRSNIQIFTHNDNVFNRFNDNFALLSWFFIFIFLIVDDIMNRIIGLVINPCSIWES